MAMNEGVLYVVATPIGNLQDITARALDTLKRVSRIAAEDTRHSRKLLGHYGIDTPLIALHEHNEREVTETLLKMLQSGADLALISDAGTPLISDPGFYLVRAVRQAGMEIVPIPGPSACIAALSVSGLPTDRFVFEGFLPSRQHARRQRLEALRSEHRTLVFYESTHRIADCLADMVEILGAGRAAVIARELTKTFETIKAGSLSDLVAWLLGDSHQQRGECVIMVHGEQPAADVAMDPKVEYVIELLMQELPLKQAAALASKITGAAKNRCYERCLELKKVSRA